MAGTSSASTLTGISRLVGARPRRFEFDLEHEDDAEALVMDMGISTDDDEETRGTHTMLPSQSFNGKTHVVFC